MRELHDRGMERNEDVLRLNPESGLGQLANETGGFLVRDTNDARAGFRRIAEDMRFHYLLVLLADERQAATAATARSR